MRCDSLNAGDALVMRYASIVSNGGRIAISRKGPAIGSPRCLQVTVGSTERIYFRSSLYNGHRLR